MYAVFHRRLFRYFAGGVPAGMVTCPDADFHAAPLPEARLLELVTIFASGFQAEACLRGGELLIYPTAVRRPVPVRVGVTGSVSDLFRLSPVQAGQRLQHLGMAATERQGAVLAVEAVRELLTQHPAPSRARLLQTFRGLWPVVHPEQRPALAESLDRALRALGEPAAAQLAALAVAELATENCSLVEGRG